MQNLHKVMPFRRRQLLKAFSAIGASGAGLPASGQEVIRVAAASDLQFALAELADAYRRQAGVRVELNLGSSGNFARQIRQGLPADIFMSADESFAFALADAGLARDRGALYALGRIALFAGHGSPVALDPELKGLRAGWAGVSKFAIANPVHAPYGRAARQALEKLGLWGLVQPKLVLADNVAQATQFVASGSAQAGITALSLALAPPVARMGRHVELPGSLHAPLRQRMLLMKSAGPAATAFYGYLQSPPARALLQRYGFSLP